MTPEKPTSYREGSIALRNLLPTVRDPIESERERRAMEAAQSSKAKLFRYMFKIRNLAQHSSHEQNEEICRIVAMVNDTVAWFQAKEAAVGTILDDDEQDQETHDDICVVCGRMQTEFDSKISQFEALTIQVFPQYPSSEVDSFRAPGRHPMPFWEWCYFDQDWEILRDDEES
jgi:hypothetical protein